MKPLSLLLAHLALIFSYNAHAHVIIDGTMNHFKGEINPNANNTITVSQDVGKIVGNNLFHSFSVFNINQGETVNFTGDSQLKNVISRVTGGGISTIDGSLQSSIGQANFYFINPAGIVFNEHASIDVPAAFHISTSDSLQFKDGHAFLASLNSTSSSLSISEPTNFGFLGDKAGDIKIASERHYIDSYDADGNSTGHYEGDYLHFNHENDVVFNANNLSINHGTLLNPSGSITFNAKQDISLSNNSLVDNSTNSSKNAGQLSLTANTITINSSVIQSNTNSTGNSGDIIINSGDITLENGGLISVSTYDKGNAGNINLIAKNLSLEGGEIASIANSISNTQAGNAGIVTINSDNITLNSDTRWVSSKIDSATRGSGNAGSIIIQDNKKLLIDNNSLMSTNTSGNGMAGTININSNNIKLDNGGTISSVTTNSGDAGNIIIANAKNLVVDNFGTIYTESDTEGQAGTVLVNSDALSLANYGKINSDAYGKGNAGVVTVNSNNLTIKDNGQISSSTNGGEGNAGTINVNSDKLLLASNGQINTMTYGQGKAGDINVLANTIAIHGQDDYGNSHISAASADISTGQTGNVKVIANKAISLYNGGQITIENDSNNLSDNEANKVKAGTINVSAPNITLDSASKINAQSLGNIGAGQLTVSFEHRLTVNNNAIITTHTKTGNGGNVVINGGELVNLHNANINTYTDNGDKSVKGGDIKITADIVLMNNAQILARGESATNGGYADLNLKGIIASNNQLVVNGKTVADFESSRFTHNIMRTADSGWTTPQLNITGSISALNRTILELPDLNKGSCNDSSVLTSSLVHSSKGGIPVDEMKSVFIPSNNTISTQQLQTAITPLLATSLTATASPCASLFLI